MEIGPNKKEYLELNIAESWIQPLYDNGYTSASILLKAKPTAVHQKIKWLSQKNKLNIPPILLEEVQAWYN